MGERHMINIKGLNKAAVLAALYNASSPRGMGFMRAHEGDMTVEQAQKMIDDNRADPVVAEQTDSPLYLPRIDPATGNIRYPGNALKFDYVLGRPLKVDLSEDEFQEYLYDRDNPPGALKVLQNAGLIPTT